MNTPQTTRRIDLLASADQATGLLASATEGPRARNVFMRELDQSELSHFEWFYLLTTLLALRDQPRANAAPP
jgi:hypothetical protein